MRQVYHPWNPFRILLETYFLWPFNITQVGCRHRIVQKRQRAELKYTQNIFAEWIHMIFTSELQDPIRGNFLKIIKFGQKIGFFKRESFETQASTFHKSSCFCKWKFCNIQHFPSSKEYHLWSDVQRGESCALSVVIVSLRVWVDKGMSRVEIELHFHKCLVKWDEYIFLGVVCRLW